MRERTDIITVTIDKFAEHWAFISSTDIEKAKTDHCAYRFIKGSTETNQEHYINYYDATKRKYLGKD